MDIIIQDDGIITPFGIQSSRETGFTMLPQTRDTTEEKETADGDIDFGTWLSMGEFNLHGVVEFDSINERTAIEDSLKAQLNSCRSSKQIAYECSPERFTVIRLSGKPEITRHPHHLEIRATFKTDPFWYSTEEHSLTGGGVITNAGSFETTLNIAITGSATNPSLTIGDKTLSYAGTIPAGQTLVIAVMDEDTGTVKLNGVNAIAGYNGAFPVLQPGSVNVVAGSNITIRWRDRWI